MADHLSPEQRSKCMSKIRSANTTPEMCVRRIIHSMGYRYRLHNKDLPGKPDLVFPKLKKIIFVHGCFWHWHECKRIPKSNQEYWRKKLDNNRKRDEIVTHSLRELGWDVEVIWECQVKNKNDLFSRIVGFLGMRH